MAFEKLMEYAKLLETKRLELAECSVWDDKYDFLEIELESLGKIFEKVLNNNLEAGNITNHEFNLLVLTAFYDYPDGLQPDPEFDI